MKPVYKAIIAGAITIFVYLLVVVLTTPALEPMDAINAAFQLNSIVIVGMGVGIGLQIFLSEKSKLLGCTLSVKKKALVEILEALLLRLFSLFSLWFHWVVVAGGCMLFLYSQVLWALVFLQY